VQEALEASEGEGAVIQIKRPLGVSSTMTRVKHAPRRALAKSRKPPTCWAELPDGRMCPFPQTLSDEGYWTGSCANEYHAAQVRQKGDLL
jgi:hypothetical protein